MMRRLILGSSVALLASVTQLHADGYRMKDGRYSSGAVTVLTLTRQQILTTKTKRVVVLTGPQRAMLREAAGKAPTVLSIHSLKVAGRDCTCGEYNFAIWFTQDRIEVPHRFLQTDDEAAESADEWDSMEYPPAHSSGAGAAEQ